MRKSDKQLLEKYAQEIFGCSYDDLSDKEAEMLKAHIRERESDFENCRGLFPG